MHSANSYRELIFEADLAIIAFACSAMVDTLIFVPSAMFTLICPSLWVCTYEGIKDCFKPDRYSNVMDWNNCFVSARVIAIFRIPYALYDMFCMPLALLALLSPLRHGPFLQAMHEDGLKTCACQVDTQHDVMIEEMEAPAPSQQAASMRRAAAQVPNNRNELFYNIKLRRNCVYFGSTALVDLLLCPILLPLLITWYRFVPVKDALLPRSSSPPVNAVQREQEQSTVSEELAGDARKEGDTAPPPEAISTISHSRRAILWGFEEYGIISRQFLFLLLDLLFLPGTVVLFITQLRWRPLAMARKNDDLCSSKSFVVYGMVVWSVVLLVIDVLTLPFALFVLFTYYRSGPIIAAWKSVRIWNGFPRATDGALTWQGSNPDECSMCCQPEVFFTHCAVFANFFLILHDVCFVPLLAVISLVSGIRSAGAVKIIAEALEPCGSIAHRYQEPASLIVTEHTDDVVTAQPLPVVDIAIGDRSQYTEFSHSGAAPRRTNEDDDIDDTPYPEILPTNQWRQKLWIQVMNLLFDLPFVVIAVIVMFTVWRARELYKALAKVEASTRYDTDLCGGGNGCCDDDDCCCCCCSNCCDCCCGWICGHSSKNWRRRIAVIEQFLLLIRDILFLIPFALVVCTLYRLPGLVLDIIARCFPANRTAPALVPTEVRIQCPEESKDPIMIYVTCRRNALTEIGEVHVGGPIRYKPAVKMFLVGSEFWADVARIVGDGVMRLGKSMIPLKLKEGQSVGPLVEMVDMGEVSETSNEGQLYTLWIKLDFKVKRTTLLKKLQAMHGVSHINRSSNNIANV